MVVDESKKLNRVSPVQALSLVVSGKLSLFANFILWEQYDKKNIVGTKFRIKLENRKYCTNVTNIFFLANTNVTNIVSYGRACVYRSKPQ